MIPKEIAEQSARSLLPCPFCGVKPTAVIRGEGNIARNPRARCLTEDCMGSKLPSIMLDVPGQVEAWNTRSSQLANPQETIIEYGVNEIMPGGAGHNPFDSNFETQDLAEQAGRNYLTENPDVPKVVVFRLTIVNNTITEDGTLLTIDRSDLENGQLAERTTVCA